MSSPRWYNDRVKEQLRREIAWAIQNEVRDPRVPPMVTVSEIKLAADTRNATVFVSIYDTPEKRKDALVALNGAAPFIQNIVAQRVSIKHFPKLHFKLDESLDRREHINELLDKIKDDLG
ncbi:MAG: 30S ribosome-binding factor RbfA [Chitinivibrionales bacterium]|nr:30S ribosome-binding factor RbfA [Chitinivibrionales bacterium]MBD3357299.1 30S ribosome-binding factor RbfA [Chitinivibrionales bacterium]